jgi:hypothetical protein
VYRSNLDGRPDAKKMIIDAIDILALSTATIRRAQEGIASCESCNGEAELPFDWVLDEVTGHNGSTTDYFLTEPARCPHCGGNVTEKTLVEPSGGVFSI